MSDVEEIKKEIEHLLAEGSNLTMMLLSEREVGECNDLPTFLGTYEIWYTKCIPVIRLLSPDRMQDFMLLYSNPKRKTLDEYSYCISDALSDTRGVLNSYGPWSAAHCVVRQVGMLRACYDNFDDKLSHITTILQADIFDSEIDSSKHLLKMGFLRASGAICGVVIEKHFSDVCKNRGITITKKNPTIADYNDKLKDVAYDTIEWRRIQRLGDLRNLCDHNKDREPTKEEVDELISGTERVTKTIF